MGQAPPAEGVGNASVLSRSPYARTELVSENGEDQWDHCTDQDGEEVQAASCRALKAMEAVQIVLRMQWKAKEESVGD